MRIVVAMSGGVDSSVAAALLAEQGHEVIGLSMQLYDASTQTDGTRTFGSCCTLDDLHDARRVAAAINIAHCNSDLKFSTLLERARGFGADAVATGHYARVAHDAATGRHLLKRGLDAA